MVNSQNNKNFPMPGPQQCHPRVGDVRPEWGCLPVETLKKVAKMYGINSEKNLSTLRSEIEMHV